MHELDFRQFAEKLGEVVSHSKPVETFNHLKGRATQFSDVQKAIYAPGRHVFVLGERGVGKTSLAKTAGLAAASGSKCFRHIGCSSNSTFDGLMRQSISMFGSSKLSAVCKSTGFSLGAFGFGLSSSTQISGSAPQSLTASDAADILCGLSDDGSNDVRVVLVDEVDRLMLPDVRLQLAELVKLMGDRAARLTFIFTGVGKDLSEILGHHESAFRQIEEIELERIEYQTSLDIIDDALGTFGLNPKDEPMRTARFRIAAISNGFPYYVHLLMEKLLYKIYEDRQASSVTLEHLQAAIAAAVTGAQMEIRKPYDKATSGRTDRYKLATWAAADSWDLERTSTEIYASYQGISMELDQAPITKTQFLQVLASLKSQKYGPILKAGFRKGQYEFSENIVRGYVRLRASAEGVDLRDLQPSAPVKYIVTGRQKRHFDPRKHSGPSGFSR